MNAMADTSFEYTAVLHSDGSGRPVNVIAHQVRAEQPLRAVVWSFLHHSWISAPDTAAGLLYDDRNFDRLQSIDRSAAERLSRDALHAELPAEDMLNALSDEGERMGWN